MLSVILNVYTSYGFLAHKNFINKPHDIQYFKKVIPLLVNIMNNAINQHTTAQLYTHTCIPDRCYKHHGGEPDNDYMC